MQKVLVAGIAAALLVGAAAAGYEMKSQLTKDGAQPSSPSSVPSASVSPTPSQSNEPASESFTISNVTSSVKGEYDLTDTVGEITNNDKVSHTVTLRATYYAKDGKIAGTASGAVPSIKPGEKKTFELLGSAIPADATVKVQVETVL